MSENETSIATVPAVLRTLNNLPTDELDLLGSPSGIVEVITGACLSDRKDVLMSAARIAKAAFHGQLTVQFLREVSLLKEKGKIVADFEKEKKGYKTWMDILTAIDSGDTDEEKLEALKAMFYAVNKVNSEDIERILAYELFQIAKKLTSGELMVLRTVYRNKDKIAQMPRALGEYEVGITQWLEFVSAEMKHGLREMVELHEKALVEHKLLSPRSGQDTIVRKVEGRLTALGIQFCRNIETYELETKESND